MTIKVNRRPAKIAQLSIQPFKAKVSDIIVKPKKHIVTFDSRDKIVSPSSIIKVAYPTFKREQLLSRHGIDIFKPSILMTTEFTPAYDVNDRLTPLGEMLMTQIFARDVQYDAIKRFIQTLRDDDDIRDILSVLESRFMTSLSDARNDINTLKNILVTIDNIVRKFDVKRNEDLTIVSGRFTSDDVSITLRDMFVDIFGFTDDAYELFTNTKIVGQLLLELSSAIRSYTNVFKDALNRERQDDTDPIKYKTTQPTSDTSFDISKFKSDGSVGKNAFDRKVFIQLVTSLPNTSTSRIKVLSTTLSRLLSISSALGRIDVQTKLNQLGLDLGSHDIIHDLIGTTGPTIFDSYSERGMLNVLSLSTNDNVDVLPFENKHIVTDRGKRFVPGSDYFFEGFFDNDTTRLSEFNRRLGRTWGSALDVIDVTLRSNSKYSQGIWGDNNQTLRADTIYLETIQSISSLLRRIDLTSFESRNTLFILAAVILSQSDRQLRDLLFQLLLLSVVWEKKFGVDTTSKIGIVDDVLRNEVKTYNDMSSMNNVTLNIVNDSLNNGEGTKLSFKRNVGDISIDDPTVITAAQRYIQRRIVERIVDIVGGDIKSGVMSFIGTNNLTSRADNIENRGSVKSSKMTLDISIPDNSSDMNTAFHKFMLHIARLIDRFEDIAGHNTNQHLLDDATGRTRFMHINSSVRMLLWFELFTTIIGSNMFASFDGIVDSSRIKISVDKTRISSFITATTPNIRLRGVKVKSSNSFYYVPKGTTKTHISKLKNIGVNVENTGKLISRDLSDRIKRDIDVIATALRSDIELITTMISYLRAISSSIDDEVSKVVNTPSEQRDVFDLVSFAPINRLKQVRIATNLTNITPTQTRNTIKTVKFGGFDIDKFKRKTVILSKLSRDDVDKIDRRDKDARKLLTTRQQVMLANVKLDEIDASLEQDRVFVDDSRIDVNTRSALTAFLRDTHSKEGYHILSVAIPSGLTDRLNEMDILAGDVVGTNSRRRRDIITIDVHMRDMLNEDIVYKPINFVFELSKFVTHRSFVGVDTSGNVSFDDMIEHDINILDMSSFDEIVKQKHDEFINDKLYSNVPIDTKRQLFRNHIVSYMLGLYIRLLTGVDVREHSFPAERLAHRLQDDELTRQAYDKIVDIITARSSDRTTITDLRSNYAEFDALLSDIEQGEYNPGIIDKWSTVNTMNTKADTFVLDEITDLAKLAGSKSILTAGERLRRAITSPKLFDRIFNIRVKRSQFEIDEKLTKSTRSGQHALRRLVGRLDHDTSNDVSLEQYFVTISRYQIRDDENITTSNITDTLKIVTPITSISK